MKLEFPVTSQFSVLYVVCGWFYLLAKHGAWADCMRWYNIRPTLTFHKYQVGQINS